MFNVGDRVRYYPNDTSREGTVLQVLGDYVLAHFDGLTTGGNRAFDQNGQRPHNTDYPFAEYGRWIDIGSCVELISTEVTQPMFTCGQQIHYHYESGVAQGYISDMSSDHILVELVFPDGRSGQRALNVDGRGPPRSHHWATNAPHAAYITAPGPTPEWQPTPGREYPPEPTIGYGAFDERGRPVQPGHTTVVYAGFGILNLPQSMRSSTTSGSANDALLEEYMRQAKEKWRDECLNVDFAAVENKLEFLIGLQIRYTEIGGETLWFEFRHQARNYTVTFDYSANGMSIGPDPRYQVQDRMRGRTVTLVEGNKIILDDSYEFTIMSHAAPVVAPNAEVKKILLRNLATQRAEQDSPIAIAA